MERALSAGDFLLAIRPRQVRAGSIVVVERPDRPGFELVKRVAGCPGDSVDGVELGAGQYWVLGDRPSQSTDSRTFGAVDRERIRGVVVLRYWPPGRVASATST